MDLGGDEDNGEESSSSLGLEVYVNLGIGPILSGNRIRVRILLKELPCKEMAITNLPTDFVVLEEHGVDHIDLLPE